MISDSRRSAGLRTGLLVLGLAAILAVVVALAYTMTASAQGDGGTSSGSGAEPTATPEPTSTPEITPTAQPATAPDGKGKDDEEDDATSGAGGASGSSGASGTACTVTSLGTLTRSASRTGSWTSSCNSTNRSGRYARFYSFTLSEAADVVIDLTSSVDPYMFLLNGSGTTASRLASDDDGGDGNNSRIKSSLAAGTYTIEATTYASSRTGSFSLSVAVTEPCINQLGTLTGSVVKSGSWARGCDSDNRSGRYARYYTFNVPAQSEVEIDLASLGTPVMDTHLYLLSGAGKTGSIVESDSNDGPGNDGRIVRTLAPGTYTIEATTNPSSTVGKFSLRVTAAALPCQISLGTLEGAVVRDGIWSQECASENRSNRYARFYTFTLTSTETVRINLDSTGSPTVNTYLNLLSGSDVSGSVLASDDDSGSGRNSYLLRRLTAGTYTIEATTDYSRRKGDFRLSVVIAGSSSDCSVSSLGTIASDAREARVGHWDRSCVSQNRSGKYARFYSFTVSGTKDVRIDLRSVDDPEVDTYLYLISGSSKTGTVLERDDDGGDGRNSRITRRLTSGTYTIEATTFSSAQVGNFSLAVEVEKPVAEVSSSPVFLGQSVSLVATAPSSKGEVSRYQWQRWNGSGWSSYGSSSTSSTRTATFSTEGAQTFRVKVTYTSGGQGTSSPVSARWVSIAHAAYGPHNPDQGGTVVLTVPIADSPTGTTYQWQRRTGTGSWSNYLTSSASRSQTVSYSTKGTRQFRVRVSYSVGSRTFTETSDEIYVTWGEDRIVLALFDDLDAALFGRAAGSGDGASGTAATPGNANLASAQTSFLTCVNTGRDEDDQFDSFYDVLSAYDGAVATTVDSCESRTTSPTRMFSTYKTSVTAELNSLKTSQTLYRDYLASPRGSMLSEGLGSSHLLKLLGSARALSIRGTESGASGDANEQPPDPEPNTGANCVPSAEPSTLSSKLDTLNCLVFRTPHTFWVNVSADFRDKIDQGKWLGSGDWVCTLSPDGVLPSCRKHDVAYHSLQMFADTDSSELLDRTWNPRNKALADAKMWADVFHFGCWGGSTGQWICLNGYKSAANFYFRGVAYFNNKGWPVTTHDLDDARAHRDEDEDESTTGRVSTHAFVDCEEEVPTVGGVTIQRVNRNEDFRVSWRHVDGCVDDITIHHLSGHLAVWFDNGDYGEAILNNLSGASTQATFSMDQHSEFAPVWAQFTIFLSPNDREYGGVSYEHSFAWDWTR